MTVTQSGTATSGGGRTITLAAAAVAVDNTYVGQIIAITGGAGVGQARRITDYVGSTRIATVAYTWETNPSGTSTYEVNADASPAVIFSNTGEATAGSGLTISLSTTSVAVDGWYDGQIVAIVDGDGAGQARRITSYVASSHVATVNRAWETNPSSNSLYNIIPDDRVDIFAWNGAAVPTSSVAGVPKVDADYTSGSNTALTTWSRFWGEGVGAHDDRFAVSATSTTVVVDDSSFSAVDDFYNDMTLYVYTGTGGGQGKRVSGYVGSTKTFTVDSAFAVTPDDTSGVMILPFTTATNVTHVSGVAEDLTTATEIAALDAVVDTVKAETALIVADTNELQTDDVPTLIAALPTAAENSADLLGTSLVEPTASDVTYSGLTVAKAIQWLFAGFRNKKTLDRSTNAAALRNDADAASLLTWTVTDASSITTDNEKA